MLGVTSSAGFSAPDVSTTGSPPSAAAERDAGGPALPFAAMLATRLASGSTRSSTVPPNEGETAATGEHVTDGDSTGTGARATALDHALAALVSGAASASPTTSANVRHVTRDAATLTPALRERLGRVVARMQDEYGYKVQIAEAGRTQARQDYLFGQGRTRSGSVVTWTRDSAHTRGRAVDVTIDGSYDNPTAFARLQAIAQAEGLQTLGMRDPGHLQLPRSVPGSVAALPASVLGVADGGARITVESIGTRTEPGSAPAPGPAPAQAPGGVAPVAAVASVAPVAGVAQVAAVASVASPGSLQALDGADARVTGRDDAHRSSRAGSTATASAAARGRETDPPSSGATIPPVAGAAGEAASGGARREAGADTSGRQHEGRPTRDHVPSAAVNTTSAPTWGGPSIGAVASDTAIAPSSSAAQASGPVLGAIAAERLARVLDAQQATAPRTVSHLTLRVERAEGGEDRIHLDLRGRAVDARIDVGDGGAADQLAARTPELRAALAQHGFTTDEVRVQSGAGIALAAGTRDPSRDQNARDSGGRGDQAPDNHRSDRDPRDGSSGDDRQKRRPPADAYLDLPTPNATRRTAS